MGTRLVPLLVERGYAVTGLTRSNPDLVAALGGTPVVCDVLDPVGLRDAIRGVRPDVVVHQLTDLPDSIGDLERHLAGHHRVRLEGLQNLLDATGGVPVFVQSIAFPPGAPELENVVLGARGVVLRYGRWYGQGTWYEDGLPPEPRIEIGEAARRTVEALAQPAGGIVELTDAT